MTFLFAISNMIVIYIYMLNIHPKFGDKGQKRSNNETKSSLKETLSSSLKPPQSTIDPISSSVQLFIKTMMSETILSNSNFAKYRHDSLRYFGQQHRMENLLRKIFQGKKSNLNILVTGGSISGGKVFSICHIFNIIIIIANEQGKETYHQVFSDELRKAAALSNLTLNIKTDNISRGGIRRYIILIPLPENIYHHYHH